MSDYKQVDYPPPSRIYANYWGRNGYACQQGIHLQLDGINDTRHVVLTPINWQHRRGSCEMVIPAGCIDSVIAALEELKQKR